MTAPEQSEARPTHLDLFSGIGGFAIAAQAAGFDTIGFSENDYYACKILKRHRPDIPNFGDIRSLTGKMIYGILDSCNGNAPNVKSDTSQATGHTASHATPSESPDGGKQTYNTAEKNKTNGAKKSAGKSSPTTEGNANAVENPTLNFSPLTTNLTTETRSEKSIRGQHGKLPCEGDFPTTIKSYATTVTKQNPILEYAHTRKRIDLVTGGFPCQPYSLAGKRAGKEDDRALWPQIVRLLQEMDAIAGLPAWCLFENVPGIITLELDRVLADLEAIGYAAWPIVIPACAVDARHRRDRVWILAYSESNDRRRRLREAGTEQDRNLAANGGAAVADADGERREGQRLPIQQGRPLQTGAETDRRCSALADATGWQEQRLAEPVEAQHAAAECGGEAVGNSSHRTNEAACWAVEPPICRMAHGIPNRSHRLRGLGNAIVPQVAEVLMREIARTLKISTKP